MTSETWVDHRTRDLPANFRTLLYALVFCSEEYWPASNRSITEIYFLIEIYFFIKTTAYLRHLHWNQWEGLSPQDHHRRQLSGPEAELAIKWVSKQIRAQTWGQVDFPNHWKSWQRQTSFLAKMTWGRDPPWVTLFPHQRASKPLFSLSTWISFVRRRFRNVPGKATSI